MQCFKSLRFRPSWEKLLYNVELLFGENVFVPNLLVLYLITPIKAFQEDN